MTYKSIRRRITVLLIFTMVLSVIGSGGILGHSLTAQAADVWKPMDTEPMTVPGSAVDLSGLNDAPAGKYGFIQQGIDGDYTFEQAPQKKVKLYGANITWNMFYGSNDDADQTANRLARLGYNVVRIHAQDAMADWAQGIFIQNGSTTPQLNADRLDRLEYFIAKLKSKGIYVTIDIFHLYDFKNIPGLGEYADGTKSPYLLPLLPQALDMWKAIADKWLSHVNPYTGLPLKHDPVLIGVSPWNESLLLNMNLSGMKVPLRDYMLQDFNQYLESIGKPDILSFPGNYWDAAGDMKDQLSAYYSNKTIHVSNAMRTYLKEDLGVKAPIGGLNYIYSPNVNYWRDQASDVYETHAYYQFSNNRFTDSNGSGYQYNPLKEPRLSMAFNSTTIANYPKDWPTDTNFGSYYPALSLRQPYAKPFVLTEFQDTQPVKGREDIGIFNGAVGAYQGWDMMNRYSFGVNIGDAYKNMKLGAPEEFSIVGDPLAIMSEAEAVLLFRNGAIQTASPKFVFVWDRTWSRDKAAASEGDAYLTNMMYIPHLFKTVSVYADKPNVPFSVYKITSDLTPDQIASGNLPEANRLPISSSMTNRQMAELFINSLDDTNKKTEMLVALNQNKLLSDTGELTFDLNLDTYFVNTPKVIAAAGTMNNHTFALGQATVTGDVDKGTFFASSLDGNSLQNSDSMLLVYTTDVAATGEQYVLLPSGDIKYYKGTLPTLVKQQRAKFTLTTNKPAGGFKAYKLALNGARLQEIPVTVNGQVLSVSLNTDKGLAFELVYDPLYSTDFESGAAEWTAVKGNFGIHTESNGNHVYRTTKQSTSVVEQTYGSDYFVESDVRLTSFKDTVGLLARYVNPGKYYSFTYDALLGKASIERQNNDQTIVLQSTAGLTMPLDVMNNLRFEVAGNNLNGYINGQLVVTATDSTIANGSAGILTKDLVLPAGFPLGTASQQWIAALGSGIKGAINEGISSSNGTFITKLLEVLKRVMGPVSYDNFLVAYRDVTAPSVPSNVMATPLSSYEVSLSWTPSTDNDRVAGYIIYRDGQEIASVNGMSTSYVDTGLSLGTTYAYTMKAFDPANNHSNVSSNAIATTKSSLLEDNFESGSANGWSVVSSWGTFAVVTDGSTKAYLSDNTDKGATKSVAGQSSWTDYRIEAKAKMDQTKGRIGLVARFVDYNNYYSMTYESYTQKVYISKVQNGNITDLAVSAAITPLAAGTYHTLGFTVIGNTLQAYVNGQLLAMATDSAFAAGKIGVYTHLSKGYFDDIAVNLFPNPDVTPPTSPSGLTAAALSSSEVALSWAQSSDDTGVTSYAIYRDQQLIGTVNGVVSTYKDTGLNLATTYHYTVRALDAANNQSEASSEAIVTTNNTLLTNNFESGNASGWSVVSSWGNFSVVSDVYGSKAYLSDNADKGGTKSVAGTSTWTNYSVEAKGKMETASGRMGLVARFIDYNNYYTMTYDNFTKKVYLSKLQNGSITDLAISAAITPLAAGTYHTLRFTVVGNTLQAYVNGNPILSATDSTFSAGKIGVYTHMLKAYFDDVVVSIAP
ncbi:cellulase family glycosylhydrolase [Paenibacillus sp. LMG 31461]|uniref:Cellulase family glycosylhydrolase n=1 Tax=Paenibacillus plantarum TaxID=2654975 RepID=A0ABX1XLS9_9BACL|nr:family 16 glycoside hydrolase [Paenibacillus plantarum]NOU69392.1 cellulase family glycosylhydrolase [Paenibacillus plantarum]